MNKLLNFAHMLLEQEEEYVIPAKKLWLMLPGEEKGRERTFHDFVTILAQDKRFSLYGLGEEISTLEESDDIFFGPKVMLKKKHSNKQQLATLLIERAEQVTEALQNLADASFDQVGEEEKVRFLEILNDAAVLKEQLMDVLDELSKPQKQKAVASTKQHTNISKIHYEFE